MPPCLSSLPNRLTRFGKHYASRKRRQTVCRTTFLTVAILTFALRNAGFSETCVMDRGKQEGIWGRSNNVDNDGGMGIDERTVMSATYPQPQSTLNDGVYSAPTLASPRMTPAPRM